MLKKFFLNVLSSFVGTWVAIVLAGVVAVCLAIAFIGNIFSGQEVSVRDGSILRITLNSPLEERIGKYQLTLSDIMTGDITMPLSVEELTAAIGEARTNDDVKAIYLDCGQLSGAPASLNAVREALLEFKKSNKKIYAYADNMSQGAYFLASVADCVAINPAGQMSLRGLGGQMLFYKGLFDKIGVQFQAVRVGKGKAAVEPYTCDSMSSVARQQSLQLSDTIWIQLRRALSASRPALTPQIIDTLINVDYISQRPASFLLHHKLVDALAYRHNFEDSIAKLEGQKDGLKKVVNTKVLASISPLAKANPSQDDQIAVLYAVGEIDTSIGDGGINSAKLVDNILELAENDDVKGLVLRVCSPGGSAFGSEQIWEALQTFKKTGKPLAVSMGDYAASGGYYISCSADRIFADPYTITGSIGIFGLIPNVGGLLGKLGIHVETVGTNPAALFPAFYTPMDAAQTAAMQSMVENGYRLFVSRCAAGRNLPVAQIETIADGRPLPAVLALQNKLIDQLGSLQQAIEWTAAKAKMKDYNVVPYPNGQQSLTEMLNKLATEQMEISPVMKLLTTGDVQQYSQAAQTLVEKLTAASPVRAQMMPLQIKF